MKKFCEHCGNKYEVSMICIDLEGNYLTYFCSSKCLVDYIKIAYGLSSNWGLRMVEVPVWSNGTLILIEVQDYGMSIEALVNVIVIAFGLIILIGLGILIRRKICNRRS